MASVQDLAGLSEAIYDLKPYKGWEIKTKYVAGVDNVANIDPSKGVKDKNKSQGFQAALYSRWGEDVVVFCGSNDRTDWLRDNRQIFQGHLSLQTKQAIQFFAYIKGIKYGDYWSEDIYNRYNDTPTFDTTVTGHSLGGVLATIVGNKYALYTVAFNAPPTSGLKTTLYKLDENGNILIPEDIDNGVTSAYSVELLPSDESWDNIYQFIISGDFASDRTGHFGQVQYAQAYYDSTHLLAHFQDQWLIPERYDADGNFDPDQWINKKKTVPTDFVGSD